MKKRLLIAAMMLCAWTARAVPVAPATIPHITFVNGVGLPCAGCKLYTYAAGTTTPLATYTDSTGTSQNTNPITLDAAGGANIWLGISSYKFILKDPLGTTIWSVDGVNAGNLFPCAPAGAVQIANSAATGLTCDSSITINTTNHTLNIGTLPANHVTIGALGTPTSWNFDTTSPDTARNSLNAGQVGAGTIGQVAVYAATGTAVQGATALPNGITATTQTPGDNSLLLATTAYVTLPGAINPTSVQVATGVAMTDNQGNGALVQHSTGAVVSGNCAKFDADGNTVDSGISCGAISQTITTNGLITEYHNTGTSSRFVTVSLNTTCTSCGGTDTVGVGPTSGGEVTVATTSPISAGSSVAGTSVTFIVPAGYFYKITPNNGNTTVGVWTEWQ